MADIVTYGWSYNVRMLCVSDVMSMISLVSMHIHGNYLCMMCFVTSAQLGFYGEQLHNDLYIIIQLCAVLLLLLLKIEWKCIESNGKLITAIIIITESITS